MTLLPSLEAAGLPTAVAAQPFAGTALLSVSGSGGARPVPPATRWEDTGSPLTPRMSPTPSSCCIPRKLESLPKRHEHTRGSQSPTHTPTLRRGQQRGSA